MRDKSLKMALLVPLFVLAASLLAFAASPAGSQAQGFAPGTVYEKPSAPVQVSGLDAFVVDATAAKQASVTLRGPDAVVVVWPVGASVPETALSLSPPAKGAAGYRAAQAAASFTNMPAEGLPELVDLPPFASMAKVSASSPGQYTLDLSKAQSGAKAYMVAVRDGSQVRLAVSLARLSISASGRQVIEARLYDASNNTPLTGFRVEARLREGAGKASLPIRLKDDGIAPDRNAGDGVYAAFLPQGRPGEMADVKVDAYGTWQGLPLHRVAQTAFGRQGGQVSIQSVGAPIISRDEKQELESLRLPVRLSVLKPGNYRVQAVLTGGSPGEEVLVAYASTEANLARSGEVILEFPGDTLARAGVEPPFAVRDVSVVSLDKVEVEDTLDQAGSVGGFSLAECPAPREMPEAPVKKPVQ
jgi:hypothetical protein